MSTISTHDRHVLVGFNDSPSSLAALDWAGEVAARLRLPLEVLWVLPAGGAWTLAILQVDPDRRRHDMEAHLDRICREHLTAQVVYHAHVVEGSPSAVLARRAAAPGTAMLVIGQSRRGALGDLVLGSVAHDFVHKASVPLVVIPPTWEQPSPEPAPDRDSAHVP
jgi:nucleotide-binding universal stress UspA family protein